MKALLVEFNGKTGKRAGNINPNDPKLQCYGWQDLEVHPPIEIRIIEDNRNVSQYEGIEGVTVLSNKTEINKAIDDYIPIRYGIENEVLFQEHLREKKVKLDKIEGNTKDILRELFKQGIKGMLEHKPNKV